MTERPTQIEGVRASDPEAGGHRHVRRTPLSAHGEPHVWLMGAALILCLALIVGLLGVIAYRGGRTFWPGPIDRVTMRDGEVFLGVPSGRQYYEPTARDSEAVEALRAEGELLAGAVGPDGRLLRLRYRVGNRDLNQESFRWAPAYQIVSRERPENALLIERTEWGVFLGEPKGAFLRRRYEIEPGEAAPPALDETARTELETLGTRPDGTSLVLEREWIAEGEDATLAALPRLRAEATRRSARIEEINGQRVPRLQEKLREIEWDRREARLRFERPPEPRISTPVWAGLVLATVTAATTSLWLLGIVGGTASAGRRRLGFGALALAALLILAVVLENPFGGGRLEADELARIESRLDDRAAEIRSEQATLLQTVAGLRTEDERWRLLIVDPRTGRFAPRSQSQSDEAMLVSQVVRVIPANQLGFVGRLGVYLDRWGEFLATEPRENASEGGVFPVIVGTVTLTLLLTICVVPLGVVAAIYLREYARQGWMTSVIRIAVNNLAGVPSIVYGMFGLGFFCYTLGGFVDGGSSNPLPRGSWWLLILGVVLLVALAATLSVLGARRPGQPATGRARLAAICAGTLWLAIAGLVVLVIGRTPYFHGLFAERLPEEPTFGGRGILWAALTLALLTLPVVIVATEEAISAVPKTMREGSLAAGATNWQTIRRIVLPSALPGIMTGAILAMARGAGEVAPLMLVGAVNLAPTLPVTSEPPFLHADRTFMHLGFHIYNLGFQSPDSEATEPLVWTTTLLLVTIVLVLNLGAILIRARLRRRAVGSAV